MCDLGLAKRDCFAWNEPRKQCNCLTYCYCTNEGGCSFYKKKSAVDSSAIAASIRYYAMTHGRIVNKNENKEV